MFNSVEIVVECVLNNRNRFEIWILGESRRDKDGNIHATSEYFGADNEMWRKLQDYFGWYQSYNALTGYWWLFNVMTQIIDRTGLLRF